MGHIYVHLEANCLKFLLLCDYVSLHIFVSELLVSLIAVSHVECVDLVSDVKSDDLDVSDDVLNVS